MSQQCANAVRNAWPDQRPQRVRRRSERSASRLTIVELAALVAIVLLLVAGPVLSRSTSPQDVATTVVRVEQGDTVWTIASTHPVPGLSTAQNADLIARLNDLDTSALAAGVTLRVPSAVVSASVASR